MRRGLMQWDELEIPRATLDDRLARLQSAMAEHGLDALLLYTNFIRSSAVCWITAFSPYWADGVLLVPRLGEPVFATTLSNRVASWVQSVKPVGALLHSPKPGTALAKALTEAGATRIGILERDAFPGGVDDELTAGFAGEIIEGGAAFAAARAVTDAAEWRALRHADAIAAEALALLDPAMENAGAAVGAVEQSGRLAGAEEAYIAVAPDLDTDPRFIRRSGAAPLGARFAVRATIAYKGSWVRRIRTLARDPEAAARIAAADAWLAAWQPDPAAMLGPQITPPPGAQIEHWMAESVLGTRPLAVVSSSDTAPMLAPARIVTLRLALGDVPYWGAKLLG